MAVPPKSMIFLICCYIESVGFYYSRRHDSVRPVHDAVSEK